MFSNNTVKGTFFTNPDAKQTDKMIQGKFSESVKTGRKDAAGNDEYVFETWHARFVGKAYDKAKSLTDKSKITLTKWSAHNPYVAEKKRSYPYLLVNDFEIRELGQQPQEQNPGENAAEFAAMSDFEMLDDEGAQLPF